MFNRKEATDDPVASFYLDFMQRTVPPVWIFSQKKLTVMMKKGKIH
jgi:hypothetical protein